MSILIKGMEMPTSCFFCPFREKVNPDDYVCLAMNKEFEETFSLIVGNRHKDCPLVPVPPHGDLIDRDVAYDKIAEQEGGNYVDMDAVDIGLEETPVVIPAEEEV